MQRKRNCKNSTGAMKHLEIKVLAYAVCLFPSVEGETNQIQAPSTSQGQLGPTHEALSTNENNEESSNLPSIRSESDPESIASSYLSLPSCQADEIAGGNEQSETVLGPASNEVAGPGIRGPSDFSPEVDAYQMLNFRESTIFNFSIAEFLQKFNLKEENIRQTVVRRFKFCMKKIWQDIKRYKNLSGAKYLKLLARVLKMYFIDDTNRDIADNALLEIKSLVDQFGISTFKAIYDECSCNSLYIKTLFQDPVMRKLYHLHHLLGSQGRLYFKKFKQFSDMDLSQEDERHILMYCEHFLVKYS